MGEEFKWPVKNPESLDSVEPKHYTELLTNRELNHLAFCRGYARDFAHGAPDHGSMMLIAKLSHYLDYLTTGNWPVRPGPVEKES